MAAITQPARTDPTDRSREALDLVHRWLAGPDTPSDTLVDLVRAVAAALGAADGGDPGWAAQLDHALCHRRLEDAAVVARRLAHDFGNVLTSILGFTELSLALAPDETPLRRYLTEVQRGAKQGALLTDRLRLFARRPEPSGFGSELAPAVARPRARASAGGGVGLAVDLADGLPPVALGGDEVNEVLDALLDNAREAIEGAGRVTLAARRERLERAECVGLWGGPAPGDFVGAAVSDTGRGLGADARARLFREPFFTNKPRHRGLGLAIVYGILRGHRGGLRLSDNPGGGTIARVYLPVAAPCGPRVADGGRKEPAPPGGPQPATENILVVDDDPGVLRFVGDTLRREGYRVQTASCAAEAVAVYAAALRPFSLVLSDVVMEPTSGVELARELLARDADVRLLFMSGQASSEAVRHGLGGRPVGLLPKPFRPEGLLRAVRTALGGPLTLPSPPSEGGEGRVRGRGRGDDNNPPARPPGI